MPRLSWHSCRMPPTCSAGVEDHRLDDGLLELRDAAGLGQLRRAVDLVHLAVGGRHPVQHARRRRDQVLVELALEALLHDVHVQQAEEAAPESEAQRRRGFGLVEERGVVQAQLLEGVAQLRVLVAFHRVEAGEDHRLELAEAGERLHRRPGRLGHGIAELRVAHLLDGGREEADLADAQFVHLDGLRREHADLFDVVLLPQRHQPDLHAPAEHAVNHADDDDDAAVGVVPGVEDQGLQRGLRRRRREAAGAR